MRNSGLLDLASARTFASEHRALVVDPAGEFDAVTNLKPRQVVVVLPAIDTSISSLHRSAGSTEDRGCSGQKPHKALLPLGRDRSSIFRRLNDSLVGDVIGAASLFITLIGLLILGVGLT